MPEFQLLLGPLLGFLFTAGTLLFVALNAHRTVGQPATAPAAPAEGVSSEPGPSEPGREAP